MQISPLEWPWRIVRAIFVRVLMVDFFKEGVGALFRRMGTALSVFLVAQGVPPDTVQQLLVALGVMAGLTFDVGLAIFYRRKLRQAVRLIPMAQPEGEFYYRPDPPDPVFDPEAHAARVRPR